MLSYYREYRTLEHIGFDYGASESTASRVVREVETVLIKSGKFSLPGKKRNHTLKGQIVIDKNEKIICAHTCKGTTHDFKLFKQSDLPVKPET